MFEKAINEGREKLYADIELDGDGFVRDKTVEEAEMRVEIGAKALFCGNEVREKDVSAFTDSTWLTG